MVIVFVLEEILNDIFRFLKFWFYDGLKFISNKFFDSILVIEKNFNIRLNLLNFFAPLYGERSLPAYVYAPPLRFTIILIGLFLQLINLLFFLIIFLLWISLPAILTYIIYKNG
ncbi:MAG: hypothetical protein ACP5JU_00440 [Minisyncoccia bacterium]